jgi:anti-sigma regulatory factor (Ser/Thr protein kinase)
MEEVCYTFPAKLKYLRSAAKVSREVCRDIEGFRADKDFTRDVELCVSEAFTNALKYGQSGGAENPIALYFQVFPNKIIIKIQDRGKGFNLEDLPKLDLKNLPIHGYGLYIIRSKMDDVQYVRKNDGNFLTMTKYFKQK